MSVESIKGSSDTYCCQERARHKVQMGFVGYIQHNISQLPWKSKELGIVEYWNFILLFTSRCSSTILLITWVRSLSQEDPLEKEMATNSRILAWEIPRTEEPGGLQFMGHKVSHMTEWLSHHLWSSLYQILPLDNSCFASTVLWIEHESFCIFVSISSCRRHRIYLLINKGNAGSQNILICINWLPV